MTLPYWIEKGTNTVWTKVNIPANNSVVLTVKKNGTTQPNPDEVFLLFDDFEGNSLDTNKWTTHEEITISDSILHVPAKGSMYLPVRTNVKFNRNIIVEASVKSSSYGSYTTGLIWDDDEGNINTYSEHIFLNSEGLYLRHCLNSISNIQLYAFTPQPNRFYKLKMSLSSDKIGGFVNNNGRFYVNDENTGEKYIGIDSYDGGGADVDYIFIRKYSDIEPTVQVEQITSDVYRVKITNPNSYDLTDFQVGIPISGITDTDILDISYYIPEGKQITYDDVSNTIVVVGGTEEDPVSFTDLIIADDNNGWGVIDTDENGNYVIDATIQVGDGIAQTYFKTVNSTLLFTVYGTDYPLLNVKQNADCVLENTKIATLSQLDSIYEQLENIRNEISDVKTDIKNIDNTLSNSIKQMIAYIFNAVRRLGI